MAETGMPQMMSQHGAYVLHAGLAGLHARTRMHTLTRPDTPCTHAHALTHIQIYIIFMDISPQQSLLVRALQLRYTYIAVLFKFKSYYRNLQVLYIFNFVLNKKFRAFLFVREFLKT